MAIKSFKRYEKKYILTKEQYESLLPSLLKHMDFDDHCDLDNNYNIYNIYYDTDNNDVIRHSISKPYYKEKLRLRSYKPITKLNDKVFLELKKKINGCVNKRRVVLTLEEAYKFLDTGERAKTDDFLNNQVLNEIDYYLKHHDVHNKVYISYSRKAFFAKNDRNFRVTFDTNIIARRDHLSLQEGSFGYPIIDENSYLMEVKILGSIPLWFTSILSDLEIYNTHYSKYGNEFMGYCLNKNRTYNKGREKVC